MPLRVALYDEGMPERAMIFYDCALRFSSDLWAIGVDRIGDDVDRKIDAIAADIHW